VQTGGFRRQHVPFKGVADIGSGLRGPAKLLQGEQKNLPLRLTDSDLGRVNNHVTQISQATFVTQSGDVPVKNWK